VEGSISAERRDEIVRAARERAPRRDRILDDAIAQLQDSAAQLHAIAGEAPAARSQVEQEFSSLEPDLAGHLRAEYAARMEADWAARIQADPEFWASREHALPHPQAPPPPPDRRRRRRLLGRLLSRSDRK